jgi:predicted amidophosphoribosyltransferase
MIFEGIRELVFPRTCVFCGIGTEYLCHLCFFNNFANPQFTTIENIPTLSMSRYQDLVREVVVRHKDHHFIGIRKFLSQSLSLGIKLMDLPQDCHIISIPTSPREIRRRLDDPVRFMVSGAAHLAEKKFNRAILKLDRSKKDQVGLNFDERELNMLHVFKVSEVVNRVVICDDVVTSGATLRSAVRTLKMAGIEVFANICVANTPKTRQ